MGQGWKWVWGISSTTVQAPEHVTLVTAMRMWPSPLAKHLLPSIALGKNHHHNHPMFLGSINDDGLHAFSSSIPKLHHMGISKTYIFQLWKTPLIQTVQKCTPYFCTHTHTPFSSVYINVSKAVPWIACADPAGFARLWGLQCAFPLSLHVVHSTMGFRNRPSQRLFPHRQILYRCVFVYTHITPFMCACVERYIHTPILFLCLNRWPGADLETHTMFMVCKSQILVNLDSRQPNTDLRQPFPYIRTTVSTTSWWGPRTVCYFQKKSHPSLHTSA